MSNRQKAILERAKSALSFGNCTLIALTRHGMDDWDVYFPDIDFSVRGTQADILKEIKYTMDYADNKGGN